MTNLKNLCFVVIVLVASTLSCAAQSSSTYVFFGVNADDQLGYSVSHAGDVNADGVDDFIFSAPLHDFNGTDAGVMYVQSGLDGSNLHSFAGAAAGDQFGASVSGAGDVNGDGFDDFLVGAPFADFNGTDSGSAYLFSGIDGSVIYVADGLAAGDNFGHSVSDAGDVTGDGIPDFLVGSPLEDSTFVDAGSAYVFSGADGSNTVYYDGVAAGDNLGASVSSAGDVDGDGFVDIMVGAPGDDFSGTDAGSCWVFSGSTGNSLASFAGVAPGDNLGYSLSDIGDVDRDGFADYILGAPLNDFSGADAGVAYVFSGAGTTFLYSYAGVAAGDNWGWSVSGAGDYNGDGFDDFVMSAPLQDVNGNVDAGGAYLYSGKDGNFLDGYIGNTAGSKLGFSVSGGGDVNADGFSDYMVGYPLWDFGATDGGGFELYTAETLPVLNYGGKLGNTLHLDWAPTANDPFATTGTVTCSGATPGAIGLTGVSLAPANFPIFGIRLLIANDPVNLLSTGNFGFDITGDILIPNVTRQHPVLAGSYAFIQFFETSPFIAGSNGLALLLVP